MENKKIYNRVYLFILITLIAGGLGLGSPATPETRYEGAIKKLKEASSEEERFYALNNAAKESFRIGKVDGAKNYATELLGLAPKYQKNWNYGNAIQDANIVFGRIALKAGRLDEAKADLLNAGKSPGSPTMNSFGPNMSLAKDLLESKHPEVVLEYLELCRKFWKAEFSQIDQWEAEIKSGKIPNFGANLNY